MLITMLAVVNASSRVLSLTNTKGVCASPTTYYKTMNASVLTSPASMDSLTIMNQTNALAQER